MGTETFKILIEKLVQGGRGFARSPEGVVFVDGALPGEEVVCRTVKRKRDYIHAVAIDILKPSELRAEPICRYYGICGGCDLQHLNAADQPVLKGQILRENINRIGGLTYTKEIPVYGGNTTGYRNRARFQMDSTTKNGTAGFFGRRSGSVVPIDFCPVLVPKLNELLQRPEILIRAAHETDTRSHRRQSGVYTAANETAYAIEHQEISIQVNGKQFYTEPVVFFQSNREVFSQLVSNILSGLSDGGKNAVDLYSGVGTIAAFLEDLYSNVTAVERDQSCLKYAKKNLSPTVRLISKSVESWVPEVSAEQIDLLAVDPPRTGLSPEILSTIISLHPKQILYISCDSVTFSRDLKRLAGSGDYRLRILEAYDLYPHTSHLETAALLGR